MVEPTANSAEPTLDKSSERKSAVLPSSGDSAFYGSPDSCAAFHAVWTVAKTQKSYAPNANKSNKQSQPTAVDFINLHFYSFHCFLKL